MDIHGHLNISFMLESKIFGAIYPYKKFLNENRSGDQTAIQISFTQIYASQSS